MKHQCPNCGCQFSEAILSEKAYCPVSEDGCTENCKWPCNKLRDETVKSEPTSSDGGK